MSRKILIIQGHPDQSREHFCHALAAAYRSGAEGAGFEVDELCLADMDIPVLKSEQEWNSESLPADIAEAQARIRAADHLVFVFPLWLGTMPALVKAFLEQIFRPGFAFPRGTKPGIGERLLKGKSARVVMTMGMPGLAFRWFFRAHGYRYFKRNILHFCGIRPVRADFIGMVAAPRPSLRAKWLARVEKSGRSGN